MCLFYHYKWSYLVLLSGLWYMYFVAWELWFWKTLSNFMVIHIVVWFFKCLWKIFWRFHACFIANDFCNLRFSLFLVILFHLKKQIVSLHDVFTWLHMSLMCYKWKVVGINPFRFTLPWPQTPLSVYLQNPLRKCMTDTLF